MAVQVGELYAELRLDAEQFTRGLQQGEQGLGTLSDAARRAAQTAQASSDAQVQAYGRLRQAATQAGEAARSAHDRAATAAEQVRVAEQRLAQTRNAGDADAIAAAERRVEQARRDAARQAENAAQATDRMEASARRATRAAQDIDFNRLEREARNAAEATNRIDIPSGLADRVRGLGGAMGDLSGRVGASAGSNAGGSFVSGFSDRVGNLAGKTGPIAGSLLGVVALGLAAGAALVAAIQDGMAAEKGRDLFQAQTGMTEAQARKFGLAAGESYADAFGESVEGNLETAKFAVQNGLLDPGSTQRDAEQMINSLDGVATILGEDIPAVARSAAQAVKTGFAADANDAFDLLVKGSQMGLNVSEDWLDTLDEYGTQFRQLGLTGAESIGLMSQAVKAGARDTDTAADALKEFAIRAIDGSKSSAEGYAAIGLNAEEMSAQIAKGGTDASDGLRKVLDGLRGIEDPVARNAAAVGLFGTKAEDLGQALFAMDLGTATAQMNDYEGAAKRAIDVMGNNAATSVEGAVRSITTVLDGLKAALAEAFGPQIQEWADSVSNNRAGVVQFFLDVGNGAFQGADAILGFVSGGLRGLSEFTQAGTDMSVGFLRSLADMTSGLSMMGSVLSLVIPGASAMMGDLGGMSDKLNAFANAAETGGKTVADGMNTAADGIDQRLRPALETAQQRFNEFGSGVKTSAEFNDAISKMNKEITEVGVAADGSAMKLGNVTAQMARGLDVPKALTDHLGGLVLMFKEQNRTGLEAGASVEELTKQYNGNRDALISQLMATDMSNEAAVALLDTLGLTPDLVSTQIALPGMPEAHYATDVLRDKIIGIPTSKEVHTKALTEDAIGDLRNLGLTVETLPDGTVKVTAPTDEAEGHLQAFINRERILDVRVNPQINWDAWQEAQRAFNSSGQQGPVAPVLRANGGIDVERYADGKLPSQAEIKPAQPRLIQWAEPETGGEAFIPLSPAKRARSLAILAETARRMGMALVNAEAARAVGHVKGEFGRVFQGDPNSLDESSDPTGWRALLGGQYSNRSRRFGIEEDNPLVAAILGSRKMLVDGEYSDSLRAGLGLEEDSRAVDVALGLRNLVAKGDYDGSLTKYGIEEDSPLSRGLLGFNRLLFSSFADGGITSEDPAGPAFNGDAAISLAKSKAGRPYAYATMDDCSGHLSDVFNAATGQSVRFNTASDFESMGWVKGYDPDGFSIGTNGGVGENGHMAGTLYGTNIESDGSNGVQYGGNADGAQDFEYVYHWPGATRKGNDPTDERIVDAQKALDQARADADKATDPEEKKKLTARANDLAMQLDKVKAEVEAGKGTGTSSSAGSGQAVYVTNWPSSLGGSSSSSTSTSSSTSGGTPPTGSTSTDTAEKVEHDISTPAGRNTLSQAVRAQFFANGGFGGVGVGEDHNAQIASAGSWRVFAEPETGGEAYIPLSPTKRNRSLAVWAQTGQRLGAFAAGAGLAAASGFDADGNFVGFKTNSSTIPGLEKLLEAASKPTVNIEHAEIKADDPQQLAENVVAEAGGDPMKLALMQLGL